jgi:hypothetical protein
MRTTQSDNNTLTWILTDNLNSTTVTANEDGTFNSELRYSAFGEITTPTVSPTVPPVGQLTQAKYFYRCNGKSSREKAFLGQKVENSKETSSDETGT